MYDPVTQYLPDKGVIKKFMNYTDGTEVCPRFRLFSIAAGIGAVLKRKVFFQRSSHSLFPPLFPNLWIILVAPQGRGHKSTSLRIVKNFLMAMPEQYRPNILAAKLTPEALIKALSSPQVPLEMLKNVDRTIVSAMKKPAQGVIYSSEFGVFISKKDYNKDLIPILTDLYDCPDEWVSETIMRGDQRLYDVCLTLMAASTPDWLQSMLPQDAFKGGFMSRLLLIGHPEQWHVRIPDPPKPNEEIKASIIEDLIELAKLEGEMKWVPEAKKFFEDWYMSLKEPEPGNKAAYLERKQDHLLRLSIILKLSEHKSFTLEKEFIERALNILNVCEVETLKMIDYISIDPKMRMIQRVEEVLKARKEVYESELLDEVWIYLSSIRDFDEIINFLNKRKVVTIKLTTKGILYTYNKKENNNV